MDHDAPVYLSDEEQLDLWIQRTSIAWVLRACGFYALQQVKQDKNLDLENRSFKRKIPESCTVSDAMVRSVLSHIEGLPSGVRVTTADICQSLNLSRSAASIALKVLRMTERVSFRKNGDKAYVYSRKESAE